MDGKIPRLGSYITSLSPCPGGYHPLPVDLTDTPTLTDASETFYRPAFVGGKNNFRSLKLSGKLYGYVTLCFTLIL